MEISEDDKRLDLEDIWPDWMRQGRCWGTAPVPTPLRVVALVENGKEILTCGHQVDPIFPLTEAPARSYHRLCEECGADPETIDLFMPRKGPDSYEQTKAAKSVCDGFRGKDDPCPVREEGREFAITTGQNQGVWGGTSPEDRARIRRERAGKPPVRRDRGREEVGSVGAREEPEIFNATARPGRATPIAPPGKRQGSDSTTPLGDGEE